MAASIHPGDCVRLPDGRVARVRNKTATGWRVRVRRKTSKTHQFLVVPAKQLKPTACPTGWMTPTGYRRYLRATLSKMRQRNAKKSH